MQTPSFGEKASKKCDPCLHIFFLSLIVYIFKNFSQIFADMSACLSDNKVIFTRESVLKFISSLRAWTMDICFFFLVQSYNSITDWLAICLLIKAYFKVTHLFTWWVLVENNNFEIKSRIPFQIWNILFPEKNKSASIFSLKNWIFHT